MNAIIYTFIFIILMCWALKSIKSDSREIRQIGGRRKRRRRSRRKRRRSKRKRKRKRRRKRRKGRRKRKRSRRRGRRRRGRGKRSRSKRRSRPSRVSKSKNTQARKGGLFTWQNIRKWSIYALSMYWCWTCNTEVPFWIRIIFMVGCHFFSWHYFMFYVLYHIVLKQPCSSGIGSVGGVLV